MPLISLGPNISNTHQVGVSPCDQVLGSLAIGNNTDQPVDVTIEIVNGPALYTDGPSALVLPPNGAALQDVLFNCSTQQSFTATIRVTARQNGQETVLERTVNLTILP